MWFHKNTHRPVAQADIERMKSLPRWEEDFEWIDVTQEWQHTDKEALYFGQTDLEKLLTFDLRPDTTLQAYLEGMAMAQAHQRYENTPHLRAHLTMLQATTWETEANKHMLLYRQHFIAYYSKATPGLSTEPVDLSTPAAAEETSERKVSIKSGGNESTSRSHRRQVRLNKASRSYANRARWRGCVR